MTTTILTEPEIDAAWESAPRSNRYDISRAIEAAVLAKLVDTRHAERVYGSAQNCPVLPVHIGHQAQQAVPHTPTTWPPRCWCYPEASQPAHAEERDGGVAIRDWPLPTGMRFVEKGGAD